MARKNSSGLELSFHSTGRWLKRDKEFPNGFRYFGNGKSKQDTASYQVALANYRAWQKEQTAAKRDGETWQRVYDLMIAVNKPGIDRAIIANTLKGTRVAGGEIENYLTIRAVQEQKKTEIQKIADAPAVVKTC